MTDLFFLFTENANNSARFEKESFGVTTYFEAISSNSISHMEKVNMFVQVLYSLIVMERLKLCHGDIHGKNILVLILKDYVKLYYSYNDYYSKKTFEIKTRYIPQIFDWNFSNRHEDKKSQNEYLEEFPLMGLKNWNPRTDLYLFLQNNLNFSNFTNFSKRMKETVESNLTRTFSKVYDKTKIANFINSKELR
jgi:hypothetical protein